MNMGKTEFTTDEAANQGTFTCTIYRDFTTSYSDIKLEEGAELRWILGYGVYTSYDALTPLARGYSKEMTITLLKNSIALGLSSAVAMISA